MLDKKQISMIETDVESARLTLLNLSQELVDHICCEVEFLMAKGKNFEDAYSEVKSRAGIDVLKKIQENTLYLIDKNYAIMKKFMKITGMISLMSLAFGTLFKIQHWPGGAILLLLGFLVLCCCFFPAAIYINHRDGEEKGSIVSTIAILTGGILLMLGVLFKVQHWPGSGVMMLYGWLVVLFIFIPVFLVSKLKTSTGRAEKIVYIIGALALTTFELGAMFKMFHWEGASILLILGSVSLISIFLPNFTRIRLTSGTLNIGQFIFIITLSIYGIALTSLVTLNVSGNVLTRFVDDEANSKRILVYYENQLADIKRPGLNDTLQKKIEIIDNEANKVSYLIREIKAQLIEGANENRGGNVSEKISTPQLISSSAASANVDVLMINGKTAELKGAINSFLAALSSSDAGKYNAKLLLNIDDKLVDGQNMAWEDYSFRYKTVIAAFDVLTRVEKNVRMLEVKALR